MSTPGKNPDHEQPKNPTSLGNPLTLIAQLRTSTYGLEPTVARTGGKVAKKTCRIVSPGFGGAKADNSSEVGEPS